MDEAKARPAELDPVETRRLSDAVDQARRSLDALQVQPPSPQAEEARRSLQAAEARYAAYLSSVAGYLGGG